MSRPDFPRARRILAAVATGALALTGAVVAPLAAPAPAEAAYPESFNPFSANGGFTVYARNDLSLGNTETEGSLAAGGTTTHPGDAQYAIVHVVAGTGDYTIPTVDGDPTRLLTDRYDTSSGGILAITSAGTSEPSLQGDLKLVDRDDPWQAGARGDWLRLNLDASSPDRTPIIDANAQDYPTGAEPPVGSTGGGSIYTADTADTAVADYVEANAEAEYDQAAQCFADLPTTAHPVGIAEDAGDRKVLESLSADQVNVVDYADIAGASTLQFSPGPTPGRQNPLVIQVPAGTTEVVGGRIDPQGAYSPYTLWDLSQLTGDVTVSAAGGGRMDGSIYAPNADVTVTAAPLDGQIIGNDVSLRGGEVHSFLFAGEISCDGTEEGTFRIRKELEGIEASDLPAGTSFTVNYTATEPDGTETPGSIELTPDGEWIDAGASFPEGTEVVFDEIDPASVPGYEWGDPQISPESITVGGGTADVVVTNAANERLGTFSVSKTVEVLDDDGTVIAPDGTVPVNWTARNGGEEIAAGSLDVPLDGTPVEVGRDFPAGTRVLLTEDRSAALPPDGYRWVSTAWSPGRVITIGDDETTAVGLTNTIAPDDAERTISIAKAAAGADADYGYAASYNSEGGRVDVDLPFGDPIALTDVPADAETLDLAEHLPTLDGEPTDPADWESPIFRVTVDGETTEYPTGGFEEVVGLEEALAEIPLPAEGDIAIEVGNELKQGTFQLHKEFASGAGTHLPPDVEFGVSYTAMTPGGTVTEGVIRVPANGDPVSPLDAAGDPVQFPYGTVITYGELRAPRFAHVSWERTDVSARSGTLVIGEDDQAVVSATITNVLSARLGTFDVSKNVTGIDPDALLIDDITVEYDARLPLGQEQQGSFEMPVDGTAAGPVDEHGDPLLFPLGTIVYLNEVAPSDDSLPDGYEWASTTWSPSPTLVIRGDHRSELEVTNSVVEHASFSVEKRLTGGAAGLVPADTTFPVEWTANGEAQDALEAGIGEPAVSGYLPVGSHVVLREGDLPEIPGVEWGDVSWSADGDEVQTTDAGEVVFDLKGGDQPDPLELVMTNTANVPETTDGTDDGTTDGTDDTTTDGTDDTTTDGTDDTTTDGTDDTTTDGTDDTTTDGTDDTGTDGGSDTDTDLAVTGGTVSGVVITAAAILVIGGVLLLVLRRRRRD
ncbi:DUF5979 domain-containing protein [Microbacterium halophytorum]|uniref:DUF5979 domain-containing protein n=1 Tax=Microbacterium halophytorum TaxID=2067568 RepID=UPI000CFB9F00|nr:DUF5979 domain-containing protein [Microbacterium halophytorum]